MLFMYLFEMYLLHQLQNNLHEGLFFQSRPPFKYLLVYIEPVELGKILFKGL